MRWVRRVTLEALTSRSSNDIYAHPVSTFVMDPESVVVGAVARTLLVKTMRYVRNSLSRRSTLPQRVVDITRERAHELIRGEQPTSRLGRLERWGERQFVDRVRLWSGDDLVLAVRIDDPEQVDRHGIKRYFGQRNIPVEIQGGFDTNLWSVSVKGNISTAESVAKQIGHAIERNRLRPGQTGISHRKISMDLS